MEPDIHTLLLEKRGALPDRAELDRLTETARTDRPKLLWHAATLGEAPGVAPVLLYRTLGRTLPEGAASTAVLWPGCHTAAHRLEPAVQRELDTTVKVDPAVRDRLMVLARER
ncbi:hypothetical protein ABZ372_41625, partial [Streptomyces sp. NPDC005921]